MDYSGKALGVFVSGDVKQRHAGFIIREDEAEELIHFGWHKYLLNWSRSVYLTRIGPFFPLDCTGFSDNEMEELCSFIKMLWRRHQISVPYSIICNGTDEFFNLDGSMPVKDAGQGLTCATFIMSVYSVQGYPLIDESQWQPRPEDRKWHLDILERQKSTGVEQHHIDAQTKYIGVAPRFRPEEVAGCAASYDRKPHGFCSGIDAGERVLAKMRSAGFFS